ncbi:unnamed protein product [Effrenium voratum]|nr:unnamed protein product [Effrenium voratum]
MELRAAGALPGGPPLAAPLRALPGEAFPAEKTSGVGSLQVYCDLDGVLADFNKGCLALFPEGGCIAEKIPTHTVTRLSYEEESEMWRRVESKSDFFLSLDWTSDGQELWRWIDWNVVPPAAVLTGLPLGRAGQMAAKQKESSGVCSGWAPTCPSSAAAPGTSRSSAAPTACSSTTGTTCGRPGRRGAGSSSTTPPRPRASASSRRCCSAAPRRTGR